MREVDRANLPQLLQIHRKFGWLKRSVVGKEAAGRFWLLVQHQDLSLQRKVLPEMQRAVAAGEGKPQHWGTQTSCVNGEAVLDPVDDPAGLERRRDELYLQPLGAYLKSMSEACRNFAHDLPANK